MLERFFYACSDEIKFFIVLVDQKKKFALGNSLSAVFDKNISSSEFEKEIIRPNLFDQAVEEAGAIQYAPVLFDGFKRKTIF